MDRVTTDDNGTLNYIAGLLPGLTLEQLQRLKAELIPQHQTRLLGMARRGEDAAAERHRERVLSYWSRAAPEVRVLPEVYVPPIDWPDELEEEAVAQGQDGPDPVYYVAPRFGGVETRSMSADRPEGEPDMLAPEALDALAPVYAIQAGAASVVTDGPVS